MAGKLLVAGDSFGEFSGYHNHITTSGYAPPILGANHEAEFTHWCELLAQDLDYTPINHSLGGAGVSVTSFLTMQQLQTNQYDMVVFFVSHHARSIVNRANRVAQWKQQISPLIMNDIDNNPLYDAEQHKLFEHGQTHFKPDSGNIEVRNVNAQDIFNLKEEPNCLDTHEISYLTYKTAYSYVHDSITGVLALKQYCESHNIPIVFASCFAGGVCEAINNLGIPLKHFAFWNCEHRHGFDVLDNYPSHYRHDQHQLIYNYFVECYPEIFNTQVENE